MVVIILVLVWAVALTPLVLRKRTEWRLSSSVAAFGTALRGFRRAQHQGPLAEPVPGARSQRALPPRSGSRTSGASRLARRRARRRRVLETLGGAIATMLVLGALPPLRFAWTLAVVLVVATFAYVAALVQVARQEASTRERARKVVELSRQPRPQAAEDLRTAVGGGRPPAEIHRLPPARPSFVIVEAPYRALS